MMLIKLSSFRLFGAPPLKQAGIRLKMTATRPRLLRRTQDLTTGLLADATDVSKRLDLIKLSVP